MFSVVNIVIRCMASYFITEKCIYNTPDNDSIVLEKCNFVLDKSLKSPGNSFRKKSVGTLHSYKSGHIV